MGEELSRRRFLRRGIAAGGAAGVLLSETVRAATCRLTPKQMEGPFYPESDLERDADLTQHRPGDPVAKGDVIFLSGQVLDVDCKPLSGALVEVWQACFSGRYNHSGDTNALELDPHFQYWGRSRTNDKGVYQFKTILPGYYPTSPGTYRPPHIHFKVHAPGFRSLTTQMYFDPRSYDDAETAAFVAKWNAYEKVPKSLTVHFQPGESPFALLDAQAKSGRFDLTLARL